MKKWTVPSDTQSRLVQSPLKIRNRTVESLLKDVTFRTAGPVITLFGKGGITFHKDCIVLSKTICESSFTALQSKIIFHELVHVAQQKDMGWPKFMAQYAWEWTRSGFSYKKMKKIGLEREAYALANEFLFDGGTK